MKALELFEYLAYNSRYNKASLDSLLDKQDELFKKAFITKNNELIKEYLSNGKMLADKTTIFNINTKI